jgi:hypothetical protein
LIILASTDTLELVTSSASTIDVHASWLDNGAGSVSVGRKNTAIASAATTVIVPSPSTGQRNVRTLHIRNKGISDNAVVVRHNDGTVAVEIYKQTLAVDTQFQYNDGNGFAAPP